MPERVKTYEIFMPKGPEHTRTHYLHIIPLESEEWRRVIRFRDYLRSQPEARDAYAKLKQHLAAAHPDSRAAYTAAKKAFIDKICN